MFRLHRGAPRLFQAAVLALIVVAFLGCRVDSLSESEQQIIEDIFLSGLEMQQDEYVRAETLRAIDLAGDSTLADVAGELTDDPSPLVRGAALRTLLRSGEADRPYRTALYIYNQAQSEQGRYHILDIALTEGNETVRRSLLGRVQDSNSARLRLRALEGGLLREIESARQDDDQRDLEHELIPQLDDYLDDDSPRIAAIALRALLDSGRHSRADHFLDVFEDQSNLLDDRLHAGRVLVLARVADAESIFEDILADADADDPDELGIPDQPIDERLVHIAVLGMTALGHTDYVEPARRQLGNADQEETIRIIEALAHNPSEEAAISLRSDIRGARSAVRRHTIPLYAQRDDAEADVLISTLTSDDFESRRLSLSILTDDFSDQWLDHLQRNLNPSNPDRVEQTLRLLQQLLRTDEQLDALSALQPRLEQLATGEFFDAEPGDEDDPDEGLRQQAESIANLAAYVLFRVSDDEGTYGDVISENPDPQTRAAYLEYLATHQPREHTDIFREHLHDDLYVLRLMAATGLWSAFSDTAQWPSSTDDQPSDSPDPQPSED